MTAQSFSDRLFQAVHDKQSAVVVGIDPDISLIPPAYFPRQPGPARVREAMADGVVKFSGEIMEAVADVAVAIKPQLAYFERLGPPGLAAYEKVVSIGRQLGLLVIADGKRNDIAATARQYAAAFLGIRSGDEEIFQEVDGEGPKADALTINPYLGWDGIDPFVDPLGQKGLFVLVKTSNPSSGALQDLQTVGASNAGSPSTVAGTVAGWLERFCAKTRGRLGYGPIGAVVGATYPEELVALRQAMPHVPFLIPGYGAQGGTAADVVGGFDATGLGAVVNASRSILYAYKHGDEGDVGHAARRAALHMRDDLRRAIQQR